MTSPTPVNFSSASSSNTNLTTLTLTAPAGTGGILVAHTSWAAYANTVTVNATGAVVLSSSNESALLWWPDDGATSWTLTFSNQANRPSYGIVRVSGANSASPIDVSNMNNGTGTAPAALSCSPANAADLLLVVFGWSNGNTALTMPGGLTTGWNQEDTSSNSGSSAMGYMSPSGTTTSGYTATLGVSENWWAYQVAIAPSSGATVPGAPTGVTAVAGDARATVSWTAPASNGGSPITSYTVTASPGGATQSTADGSTTSLTFTGLTNGTAYTFTVHATNSVGNSAESSPSGSVTPSGTITATAVLPLGTLTAHATASRSVNAIAVLPLGTLTVQASTGGTKIASAVLTLGAITVHATVQRTVHAAAVVTDAVTLAARLSVDRTATASIILGQLNLAAAIETAAQLFPFIPPVVYDMPNLTVEPDPMDRLMSHYSAGPRGVTVWVLLDGTITTQQPPHPDDAQTVYYGGHQYQVDSDEKAALVAAGYEVG